MGWLNLSVSDKLLGGRGLSVVCYQAVTTSPLTPADTRHQISTPQWNKYRNQRRYLLFVKAFDESLATFKIQFYLNTMQCLATVD